jgi:hypothetical protein
MGLLLLPTTSALLLLPTTSATSSKTTTLKQRNMSSLSESTAYLPVSEDNSSIEEKPTKIAVSSTRMQAVKKKVTRKETKMPSVTKRFVYAVSTRKKVVKSPPPKVASAIDRNKTKKKPSNLKKVVSTVSTKKKIVESPIAASTMVPMDLKKKLSKARKGLSPAKKGCKCKVGDCNTRNCNNCVCLSGGRPCGEDCLCVGRCKNRFNVFAVDKK